MDQINAADGSIRVCRRGKRATIIGPLHQILAEFNTPLLPNQHILRGRQPLRLIKLK